MFAKPKKDFTPEVPANSGSASIISSGTTLKGDINSNNDLRIDGIIKGNVTCTSKVVIGGSGDVTGDIIGNNVDILGKVLGNVKAKELLQLRSNAKLEGNIYAGRLQIDPTAVFNGQCHMGGNVVEMPAINAEAKNKPVVAVAAAKEK